MELLSQLPSVVMMEHGVATHPTAPCGIDLGDPGPEAFLSVAGCFTGFVPLKADPRGLTRSPGRALLKECADRYIPVWV